MTGKDPHRPQGKTKDMEHMAHAYAERDAPRQAPSDKARAELDREQMAAGGGATRFPAEEQVGGSRPGVPSRVKDAIEEREARE